MLDTYKWWVLNNFRYCLLKMSGFGPFLIISKPFEKITKIEGQGFSPYNFYILNEPPESRLGRQICLFLKKSRKLIAEGLEEIRTEDGYGYNRFHIGPLMLIP